MTRSTTRPPRPARRRLHALALATAGLALAAASSLTVAVGELQGAAGTTVEVPIEIRDAQELGALQLDLVYDPAILVAAGLEPGEAARGCTVDSNVVAPGRLRVVMNASARESLSGSGVLARAAFEVSGEAGDGCALGLERVRAWNNARPEAVPAEMLVTVEPGRFEIAAGGGGSSTPVLLGAGAALVVLLLVIGARAGRRRPAPDAGESTAPCPSCGAPLPRGARFCSSCGKAAAE